MFPQLESAKVQIAAAFVAARPLHGTISPLIGARQAP
jgi:hypothetical protein